MGLTLVLGGVRSGKSEHAERLAEATGAPVVYVATGAARPLGHTGAAAAGASLGGDDPEMAERIGRHRSRRPPGWVTIETGDPPAALGGDLAGAGEATVLVDGLSGWISALMEANGLFTAEAVAPLGPTGERGRSRVLCAIGAFAVSAAARAAETIVVADEAGLGGVPMGAGTRRFLDLAGEAAQVLARSAGAVWLVVAGQPLAVKPAPAADGAPSSSVLLRIPQRNGQRPTTPPDPAHDPDLRVHGDAEVPPGHLDFAVNVVPGTAPPWVGERLAAALERVHRYPNDTAATAGLAARHGRCPEEVLPLNGAAEAFWLLAAALRPAMAVCVHPSFTEPEAALRSAGTPVVRALRDPDDFSLDPQAVDPSAGLVVTGNPNNPTGTLDPAACVERLARRGRVLVVDEAFMDLVPGESESLAARGDLPGLVVVRSLTKSWALPGLRAGYLLGPPDLVAALRGSRQPWSVNALALAALEAYAEAPEGTTAVAEEVARAREGLEAALRRLPGVHVWPSSANFLLVRVPGGPAVLRGLLALGIAVRRCDTFPGLSPDHLRVAVRTPADNGLLLAALRKVLA